MGRSPRKNEERRVAQTAPIRPKPRSLRKGLMPRPETLFPETEKGKGTHDPRQGERDRKKKKRKSLALLALCGHSLARKGNLLVVRAKYTGYENKGSTSLRVGGEGGGDRDKTNRWPGQDDSYWETSRTAPFGWTFTDSRKKQQSSPEVNRSGKGMENWPDAVRNATEGREKKSANTLEN